jgi:hypothetical protein
MSSRGNYLKLLNHVFYSGILKPYKNLFSHAWEWDLNLRKALIKIARSCNIPPPGTQLYNQVIDSFAGVQRATKHEYIVHRDSGDLTIIDTGYDYAQLYYSDLYHFELLFSSNIVSTLTIQLIRSIPFEDRVSAQQAFISAIESELHAHKFTVDRENYNFYAIFQDPTMCINRHFPVDVTSQQYIQRRIFRWIEWCTSSNKVFYPKMSSKYAANTITERNFLGYNLQKDDRVQEYVEHASSRAFTFIEIEKYHFTTGLKLRGEEEMRYKWFFNDNKPRPYYAMGPTSFHRTTLSRQIFLNLCDQFENTHRINKLTVDELAIRPGDELYLYDFTAFTSSFYVVQCFLRDLVQFLKDYKDPSTQDAPMVTIMEAGLVSRIYLADLVNDLYLAHKDVLFKWKTPSGLETTCTAYASGLLGVFSNIVVSTLVHGIFLNILTGGSARNRCAGDDALLVGKTYQFPSWIEALLTIGSFELSKTFTTQPKYYTSGEEDGEIIENTERLVYLKRPLLYDGTLVEKWDLMPCYSFSDIFLPPHYTNQKKKPLERLSSIMTGIRRLLLFLMDISTEDISEFEYEVIRALLQLPYTISSAAHLPSCPIQGNVRHPSGVWIFDIRPYLEDKASFRLSPFHTVLLNQNLLVRFPMAIDLSVPTSASLAVGSEFESNMTAPLAYCVKLGLISKDKLLMDYFSNGTIADIEYITMMMMRDKSKLVYKFTIKEELTSDLRILIRDSEYNRFDSRNNIRAYYDDI